jgi:hypothetical protein
MAEVAEQDNGEKAAIVDLGRVQADIEILDDEVVALTNDRDGLNLQIADRVRMRDELRRFFALAEQYRAPVGILVVRSDPETVAPRNFVVATDGRAQKKSIIRSEDGLQTKIARMMLDRWQPGVVIEFPQLLEMVTDFIPADLSVKPGQWLSPYITRETQFVNGVLEQVASKKYRIREEPENFMQIVVQEPSTRDSARSNGTN